MNNNNFISKSNGTSSTQESKANTPFFILRTTQIESAENCQLFGILPYKPNVICLNNSSVGDKYWKHFSLT